MVIQDQQINRLIVAGCSFSDYCQVEKNYSEYLAEKLNIELVSGFTSGLGSNQRIFRTITTAVREKKITKSDLVVIQYTELLRKEFWSFFTQPLERGGNQEKGSFNREPYLDGQIIKYKLDAYNWQTVEEEKLLFKLITDNFISLEYEKENFENLHLALLSILEREQIRTVFVESGYLYRPLNLYEFKYCSKVNVAPPLNSPDHIEYCLADNDCTHLSIEGHKKLAQILFDHLNFIM